MRPMRHGPLLEKLLARISINPQTGCWEWTVGKDTRGYGAMWDGQKVRKAHRLSYEAHLGPIPGGLHICHRCDNPACINPDHLFPGTQLENMADATAKRRHARGNKLPQTKLSDKDITDIRAITGMKQHQIADLYGVHQSTISLIVRNKHRPA